MSNLLKPDIILEKEELFEFDEKTGNIKIDKSIFNDYIESSVINIEFTDYNENTVFQYKMIEETDEYIELEFIY